jgi:hypothetical protein
MRGHEKTLAQKTTTHSSANSSGLKTMQRKAVSVIQKMTPEEEPKQAKSDGTVQKVEEIEMEEQPLGVTQKKKLQKNPVSSNPAQRKENKTGMLNQLKAVVLQLKTVTVRNNTNDYDSGWVQAETQSTGVDDGPAAEAQRVADIAGGSWVGGHMVNDRLGGTGGYSNIIPITSSMNGQHRTIENAAKNKVGNGLGNKEVRYYMNIPSRVDYTWPNGDEVKNIPDKFKQSYDWRTKATVHAVAGPITTVTGPTLDMTL